VAEQLVPAADRQHRRLAGERRGDRVPLGLDQVVRDERLVAVLAAADVEQLVRLGIKRSPGPAADRENPIPRQAQRRSSTAMFPRSA